MNNNRIKQIIKECLQKVITEGTSNENIYNKWEYARQTLGDEKMLESIYQYLSSDQIEEIIGWLDDDYDLFDNMYESAGHIYGHDEDGKVFTNSKETYRGVPGSVFIWHGEWSDPEILYKDHELNAVDVEEGMWNTFQEYCNDEEDKKDFKEATGHDLEQNDNCYEEWLKWMGTDWIASQLDDSVWAQDGNL